MGSGSPAKSLQVIAHLLNSKVRAHLGRGVTEPEFQKLDMNLCGVKVLLFLGCVYNLCTGLEDILYIKATTSSFISKVKFKERVGSKFLEVSSFLSGSREVESSGE